MIAIGWGKAIGYTLTHYFVFLKYKDRKVVEIRIRLKRKNDLEMAWDKYAYTWRDKDEK